MDATSPARSRSTLWFWVLAGAALALGLVTAVGFGWTNDDAYISFRYADHLLRGMGLVFNAGERVEGYTNFLWTLWCALGMRLGVAPEAWANGTGLACYGATLALLASLTWSRRETPNALVLPIAALGLALHRDACIFATGGLETSLFMLLATAGYAALATRVLTTRRAALAGLVFGLATLTRPDGFVLAAFAGLWLVWDTRPRIAPAVAFACALALLLLPYLAWKLVYYGDLLPNTYHAKSVNLAWWSQGLVYVRMYFTKYWVLALGLALGLWALGRDRVTRAGAAEPRHEGTVPHVRVASPDRRQLELALALSLGFTLYVARVGGDFMFGRFLIPVTPLMLVALEIGLEHLVPPRLAPRALAAAFVLAGIALAQDPFSGKRDIRGIVNEWNYYTPGERAVMRRAGETLGTMSEGLPLKVAFFGTQAIIAYTSRVPIAIECDAGLTDRFVAHQPLARRGRVGHEKSAPWSYVIDDRHAQLALKAVRMDSLAAYVPIVTGQLGELPVLVLTWDPPVMAALTRRGARFEDFPRRLDAFIAGMPSLPDSVVRLEYGKFRRFYFASAADSAREAPFHARLLAMDAAASAPSR